MSVYVDLTREFNRGGLRVILSSGQAVVFHRLAGGGRAALPDRRE
jgi:hypothetical protein